MALFNKAKRQKAKARICLMGASGGGKTLSALYLAYGLTKDWSKIAVIDSERRRALFYAGRTDLNTGDFFHGDLEPPYTVDKYIEFMREAEEIVGEDGVIIIDSGSHAWMGTGGVLETKEIIANQMGKTEFSAWNDAGKIQNRFVDTIMDLKAHCIVTLRSKTDYAQERDSETGKTKIKKLGLKPIQRDDLEYEFTLAFDIDKDTHIASIVKDNTFLDSEGWVGVIDVSLGERLFEWLENGVEPEVFNCSECGEKLKSVKGKNGTVIPSELAEKSMKLYSKVMCGNCMIKEHNKQKENQQEK